MGEFGDFISDKLIPYLLENPIVLITLLAGLIGYFGYVYNEHNVKEKATENREYKQILALNFILIAILANIFLLFLISRWVDFKIETPIYLSIVKALAIIYSFFIIGFGALISSLVQNKFTKDEVFNLYTDNIITKYLLFQGVPFILLTFFYILFVSDTSLTFGLFFFIFIFFAFSSFTTYWPTYTNPFVYVEIYYTVSKKKPDVGRLKAIEGGLLRIQKCEPGRTFLKIIPMRSIDRIELRTLDEIKKKVDCD